MENLEPIDPRVDMAPQAVPANAGPPDHERGDITLRSIVIFTLSLVGLIALTMVLLGLWLNSFAREERRRLADVPPRFAADDETMFPEPRLQGNPGADMARWRSSEAAILTGYSWVDRDAGIARIPIARALDLTAERLASEGSASASPDRSSPPAADAEATPARDGGASPAELPEAVFQDNQGGASPDQPD